MIIYLNYYLKQTKTIILIILTITQIVIFILQTYYTSTMFSNRDFNFNYSWEHDGDILYVNHFWINEKHRGHGRASAILETLVRMAYYEDAKVIQISIGGGEKSEEFLNRNGFHIIRKREYDFEVKDIEGSYGIDAVRRV